MLFKYFLFYPISDRLERWFGRCRPRQGQGRARPRIQGHGQPTAQVKQLLQSNAYEC